MYEVQYCTPSQTLLRHARGCKQPRDWSYSILRRHDGFFQPWLNEPNQPIHFLCALLQESFLTTLLNSFGARLGNSQHDRGLSISAVARRLLRGGTHGCIPETCKLKWPGRPRTSPGKHRRPPDPGSLLCATQKYPLSFPYRAATQSLSPSLRRISSMIVRESILSEGDRNDHLSTAFFWSGRSMDEVAAVSLAGQLFCSNGDSGVLSGSLCSAER